MIRPLLQIPVLLVVVRMGMPSFRMDIDGYRLIKGVGKWRVVVASGSAVVA
jgi:hypothetical protein